LISTLIVVAFATFLFVPYSQTFNNAQYMLVTMPFKFRQSKLSCFCCMMLGCSVSILTLLFSVVAIRKYEDLLLHEPSPPTVFTGKSYSVLEHSHPYKLKYCLNLRLPGINDTMSLEDNLHLLQPLALNGRRVRVGISIFEDNNEFWGLNHNGVLHLYHFLEFLLYAYTALIQIANAVTSNVTIPVTSLSESLIEVPWIHAPYLTREELQGSRLTNQLIADLVFFQSSTLGATIMKGLEDNDDLTQKMHPSFKGKMPVTTLNLIREKLRQFHIPMNATVSHANWRTMTDAADAVVFIFRQRCDHQNIGQMHAKLVDPGYFPTNAWSKDIALGLMTDTEAQLYKTSVKIDKDKFVACYIDRQSTFRKMPYEEHVWLIKTLHDHPDVHFRRLHMERYPALEQLQIAHTCDLLVGVHGNGLSHQLFMKRGRYLVEYFWKNEFVWCYSILALLMQHDFIIFWRGKPIDSQRIRDRDSTLQGDLKRNAPLEPEAGRRAFTEFLEKAVTKFKEQRQGAQEN
jgi:Glycosyltransferase 61